MRVNDDYASWNAAQQVPDGNSVYNYWASLLQLRRDCKDLFVYGAFEMLACEDENVLAYQRSLKGAKAVIILSFSEEMADWVPGDEGVSLKNAELLICNYGAPKIENGVLSLRAFECAVFIV